MTRNEIIIAGLNAEGLDGLCNWECGCGIDDLAPCGEGPFADCVGAKRKIVPEDGRVFGDNGEEVKHELFPGQEIFVACRGISEDYI